MADNTVDGLSPKQEETILALLHEPSVSKAAAAVGAGERTVYRWMEEPQFRDAYHRARREGFRQSVGLVLKYVPLAVQTLAQIMVDTTAPHTARVMAASYLLRYGRDSMEMDDLAARMQALENAARDKHIIA